MTRDLPSKYAYSSGDDDLGLDILGPGKANAFYGAATDSDIQQILNDYFMGNPDRYGAPTDRRGERETPDLFEYPRPEKYPVDHPQNFEGERADIQDRMSDPQDFIRMQLAGDVLPMRPFGSQSYLDTMSRMADVPYPNQRGAGSINQFGGPSSPYLDLLNVLAYPSGQQFNPLYRR